MSMFGCKSDEEAYEEHLAEGSMFSRTDFQEFCSIREQAREIHSGFVSGMFQKDERVWEEVKRLENQSPSNKQQLEEETQKQREIGKIYLEKALNENNKDTKKSTRMRITVDDLRLACPIFDYSKVGILRTNESLCLTISIENFLDFLNSSLAEGYERGRSGFSESIPEIDSTCMG